MARSFLAISCTVALTCMPAQAQIFWVPPSPSTTVVSGAEPQVGLNLPGATPAELRAGLAWHLRAALNVAALQCDFEPTLLTVSNYNATIAHHKTELADAFTVLGGYFQRTVGNGKAGQNALDQYGTRIYSSYSAVQSQKAFCNSAALAGREAIFADRSKLYEVAQRRLGDVRIALAGAQGEQMFTNPTYAYRASLPMLSKKCWKKDVLTESCKQAWEKFVADRSK